MNSQELIKRHYEALNARDLNRLLHLLHVDVDWPAGEGEERLYGREAVRVHMTKMFTQDFQMHPMRVDLEQDGRVVAEVRAIFRDGSGKVQFEETGNAAFSIQDGLIRKVELTKTA